MARLLDGSVYPLLHSVGVFLDLPRALSPPFPGIMHQLHQLFFLIDAQLFPVHTGSSVDSTAPPRPGALAFTWVESIPTSYLLVISLAMHCFATSSNNRRKPSGMTASSAASGLSYCGPTPDPTVPPLGITAGPHPDGCATLSAVPMGYRTESSSADTSPAPPGQWAAAHTVAVKKGCFQGKTNTRSIRHRKCPCAKTSIAAMAERQLHPIQLEPPQIVRAPPKGT